MPATPLRTPAKHAKGKARRVNPVSAPGPAANSRLIALHQRLAAGEPLDAIQLAKKLGLCSRTIKLDIERLRDFHGAPCVKKRPWHGSQKLSPLPGGAAEVTLTLNNLIDVQRRILANGRHVEVLSPPKLRQNIAEDIAALALTYALEIATSKKTAHIS